MSEEGESTTEEGVDSSQQLNGGAGGHVEFANVLLDREVSDDYCRDWTDLLMKEKEETKAVSVFSVVIFRLGSEWLALSTQAFKEVYEVHRIHKLPHRSGKMLLGLVNLRGQLRVCVSMRRFLEVGDDEKQQQQEVDGVYRRMVVIEDGGDLWVFPVDEIYGISHFDRDVVENVPVTVAKSTTNYLKGMLTWKDKSVGYLDDEQLFNSLRRAGL